MHLELQSWLDELQADGIFLSDEPAAGARENLWCISLPTELGLEVSEWVDFLQRAVEIRRTLAELQPVRPVTFYVWHDEVAGQLRFSTAHCTRNNLPFGAGTALVEHPEEIIREFVDSPYVNGIPWTELKEISLDELDERPTGGAAFPVWAVELAL